MSHWTTQPRATFDLETTGRDPRTARVVTASILVVDGGGNVTGHHEWLADPGVEIPEEAARIHGVSTEKARSQGMPAPRAVAEIIAVLRDLFDRSVPVVVFNAPYDFTVLAEEAKRHGLPFLEHVGPVLDPYVIDRQADPYRKGKRTLGALSEHYGVNLTEAHTSKADALAALGVADILGRRYGDYLDVPLERLHSLQAEWKKEQAESLQRYLQRKDPSAVVESGWPVLDPA